MRITENLMAMNFLSRTASALSRMAEAQEQLGRKNEVLAEVMEEYVRCKKNGGVS